VDQVLFEALLQREPITKMKFNNAWKKRNHPNSIPTSGANGGSSPNTVV